MHSKRFSAAARGLLGGLIALAAATVVFAAPGRSQEQTPPVKVQKVPVQQNAEFAGPKVYRSYCAVCHGEDGKGGGPAASALKTAPPDLTLLAQKNGGKFPSERVMTTLSNESDYPVHGSKDMPIWGPVFRSMGPSTSYGYLRARNVAEYLKSIQAK